MVDDLHANTAGPAGYHRFSRNPQNEADTEEGCLRTYGRIETGFWQNPRVRAMSERGRLLLAYTMSCPHGNAIGCFSLPVGYVMADQGWNETTTRKHIRELVEARFVDWDEATSLLRIRGWWGHNKIENPNVAKAAIKAMTALPQQHPFLAAIAGSLAPHRKDLHDNVWKLFVEGFPELFEKPIAEPFVEPFRNPEPEPKPKPIQEGSDASASAAEAAPATPLDLKREVWRTAKAFLATHNLDADKAGKLCGKWLKALGPPDGETALLGILASAEANCQGDVVEYVEAAVLRRKSGNGRGSETIAGRSKPDPFGAAVAGARAAIAGSGSG